MCAICDGMTHDELQIRMHLSIARIGWRLTAVEAEGTHPGWTYTTGLIETFSHPELVIVALEASKAGHLLSHMGEWIRAGDEYRDGQQLDLGESTVRFIEVHYEQFEHGLFARWENYYDALGQIPELRALQVVVPDDWFHDGWARRQVILDSGRPLSGTDLPSPRVRRARRAFERQRRPAQPS